MGGICNAQPPGVLPGGIGGRLGSLFAYCIENKSDANSMPFTSVPYHPHRCRWCADRVLIDDANAIRGFEPDCKPIRNKAYTRGAG